MSRPRRTYGLLRPQEIGSSRVLPADSLWCVTAGSKRSSDLPVVQVKSLDAQGFPTQLIELFALSTWRDRRFVPVG